MDLLAPRLIPVLSNLAFLLPAARAFARHDWFMCYLYSFIALFGSTLYHICLGYPKACIFSLAMHHVIDFWTAQLVIPLAVPFFVRLKQGFFREWYIATAVVAMGLVVVLTEGDFFVQLIISGITLVIITIYIVWYRIVWGHFPPYDLTQLTLALGFTILAVAFFTEQNSWPHGYPYMHGYWHVFGAISQYFMQGILPSPFLPLDDDEEEEELIVDASPLLMPTAEKIKVTPVVTAVKRRL